MTAFPLRSFYIFVWYFAIDHCRSDIFSALVAKLHKYGTYYRLTNVLFKMKPNGV